MTNKTITLGGDKSISHRALIFAALSKGKSIIKNLSQCDDVKHTLNILKQCNININIKCGEYLIQGGNFYSKNNTFNCGNSGTTARLMMGLLPSQGISGTLYGDKSLSRRPMKRITAPLEEMNIKFIGGINTLPITFKSSKPKSLIYTLKVPSAQVKTSLILCSLACEKESIISDPFGTRDHTEKFLSYIGYKNKKNHYNRVSIKKFIYTVPGDISNASFIVSTALLIKGSNVVLKDILYNKTRLGYITILQKMGGNISIKNVRENCGEQICDIYAQYTENIKGINISSDEIVSMIDELPIFSLVASLAKGKTTVSGAKELRFKESDRIKSIVSILDNMNVNIIELDDGFTIYGPNKLHNTTISDFGDHRMAIILAIVQLITTRNINRTNKIINTSFPDFNKTIKAIYG